MNDQTQHEDARTADAADQAERIASSGDQIRERVRDTVVRMVRDRRVSLDELSSVAGDVMDGAIEGVKELAPQERESRLRHVIDGIADGFSRTATATRLALQEAAGRGQSFAREEVETTINDLRSLQDRFIDALTRVTNRAGDEISGQVKSLNEHIRRTATDVRPPIEDAIRAATDHPVQFAGEAASAGVRAVPKAAGLLLHAVGGVLQGAGDVLSGAGKGERTSRDETGEAGGPAGK